MDDLYFISLILTFELLFHCHICSLFYYIFHGHVTKYVRSKVVGEATEIFGGRMKKQYQVIKMYINCNKIMEIGIST